ncbi:hypothetical protein EQV97_01160 [Pseudomonas sp. TMW22090]|nr:hypothetical protein [Pseudomonas sp. TMW22090]
MLQHLNHGSVSLDIHQALGSSPLFATGSSTDHPECLVEQTVNAALTEAFNAAQALFLRERAWLRTP